jgi:hypothetical protein
VFQQGKGFHMFVSEHFARFKGCFPSPLAFVDGAKQEGKSPAAWFNNVDRTKLGSAVGALPIAVNRTSLLAMAADSGIGTAELCISIFAWGGMRGNHRDLLFARPLGPWIAIADHVRRNQLSRSRAYDSFAGLRANGDGNPIAGMGPAYFTKLLYFLAPGTPESPKGYIMDQWLGCSVNLLTGRQIVKLDQQVKWQVKDGEAKQVVDSIVSNVNSSQDYEEFCQIVEALSLRMGEPWTPELTERALIADGGKSAHPWRTYVKEQRLKHFSFA